MFYIYPKKEKYVINLNNENNYTIGGEIYKLKQNKNVKIDRLTKKNKDNKYLKNNNEDLSEINSFNQLARFTSKTNKKLSVRFNKFYTTYLRFLESITTNKSVIGDSFHLLNKTTLFELRK